MTNLVHARLLRAAAAVFALVVAPVAIAGAAGESSGPQATASAGVKKTVKKLKQQVSVLEDRLAAVEGEQGDPRPPSGGAGGDLTGSYPSPSIGGSAVDSGKVADNSLTGTDIDETTLDDPNEVFFEQQLPTGTGAAVGLASLGGVTFEADCNNAPAAGTGILFFTIPDGFSLEGDTNLPPTLRSGPLAFAGAFTEGDDDNNNSVIYQHEFHGANGTLVSATIGITTLDTEVGTDCVFYGSMRAGQG